MLKINFLNLEKEVTISNKELAKGIKACLDDQEKIELIANILDNVNIKNLNPALLNAVNEFANNLYQSSLIRKD